MTDTLDLTTMLPSEIDTILFPLWAERWRWAAYLIREQDRPAWYTDRHRAESDERIDKYQAEIDRVNAEIAPINAEYHRRGGWTRYDFVPDGHLHYFNCHTLDKGVTPTIRLLMAEASGKDEPWIVEHFAYAACTFCFPSAPAEAREVYLKEQAAARKAERDAAKAARQAKQDAKNLVEPVLVSGWRIPERIVSLYDAKARLQRDVKGRITDPVWYPHWGPERLAQQVANWDTDILVLTEALKRKGLDVDAMVAKWTKAARKEIGGWLISPPSRSWPSTGPPTPGPPGREPTETGGR